MSKYIPLKMFLIVLFFIIITGCVYLGAEVTQLSECPIRFAIIGDRTGGHTPGIYSQIVEEIERLKPDFVLTVGDMIEGYTDDTTVVISQWEEYDSLIVPLTMPIYFTPGNHDIWDDVSRELYKRFIDKPYYSFDIRDLHFIILDNSCWQSSTELPEEQINWLIDDLYEHQNAAYTIVFYHKPFWYETTADNKADTLHNLFRDFGVDAVFTGHYHIYFSGRFDDILYTGVGSSGGGCDPGPTGIEYHFIWVTVDEEGISIAPIKMDAVLAWEDVTTADLKFIYKIYFLGIDFDKSLPVGEDLNIMETELKVNINNLSDFTLDDTIHWEVPEGWFVEPEDIPVKITGNDMNTFKFSVKNEGALYPVPTFSLNFPYFKGKNYKIEKSLLVARKKYCNQVLTPPVIDGKISETIWKNPISKLFKWDGSQMMIDSVYFYFSHDDSNIYLAAHCKEAKIDSIFATVVEHDGAVYAEDCVGYFLQPDIDKGIVYQIYFNPLGVVFDQKIEKSPDGEIDYDRTWDGTYEVVTTKGDDFWDIEVCIPLIQFGVEVKSGQRWGINFRRKQKRFNSTADWQTPINYDPDTYGVLIME